MKFLLTLKYDKFDRVHGCDQYTDRPQTVQICIGMTCMCCTVG